MTSEDKAKAFIEQDDEELEAIAGRAAPPELASPKCPYCRAALQEVGWLKNEQEGLITFFHNAPGCMKVINIQAVPVQQRIIPPGGFQPRNN